jgi:hypothetical protein
MNILTNGDSFTYGDELSNLICAWPHVLANKINASVVNLGTPGASNDSIVRRTLDYVVNPLNKRPDMVIIGWSNAGRIEAADEAGVWDVWPGSQQASDVTPWRSDLIKYVSGYHSSAYYHKKYYQQVMLMQMFLNAMNINYVMLNTHYHDYYRKIFFTEVAWYRDKIDTTRFVEFDRGGMMEWTQDCVKGPGGHFLEYGHGIVADKIYEHIRNLGWLP